jgi:hypothetical protein
VGEQESYAVARKGRAGYTITFTDQGVAKSFTAHVLKTGNGFLADVRDDSGDPWLPAHLYFGLRMNQEKDTVWVAEMQSDWLKAQIAANGQPRNEVLTEEGVNGKVVLIAPQADLRKYLLPFARDARAFSEEAELHRVK